jgi:hypothetical protein
MKLGTLLLRNGAISLTQLEAALRAQVLYGGRLGTNLVELGFLDVDGLGVYLAELRGLPSATGALLDGAPRDVLDKVGADLADHHGVVPLGFLPPFPDALAVAMVDPQDEAALDDLHRHTGHSIAPYVVPELRLLYDLEKHYGVARKARFVRPGTRRILTSADERRRSQPAGGLVMPPAVRLEPRRKRTSTGGLESGTPEPFSGADGSGPTAPPLAYPAACDRIDNAQHRDEIAQALIDFAVGRFELLVVFLVRDGNALGWRAHVATARGIGAPLEELALPLGGASALQSAHDALRPFRGGTPSAAHPVESRLWQALGVEPVPTDMLVTPIIVKQRVVNLIYAHAPGGAAMVDTWSDELCELAVRASTSYVRLIRQSKTSLVPT